MGQESSTLQVNAEPGWVSLPFYFHVQNDAHVTSTRKKNDKIYRPDGKRRGNRSRIKRWYELKSGEGQGGGVHLQLQNKNDTRETDMRTDTGHVRGAPHCPSLLLFSPAICLFVFFPLS